MPGTVLIAVEYNNGHFRKYMSKMHTLLDGEKCYGEEKKSEKGGRIAGIGIPFK